MSKDPAFLFYSQSFYESTRMMLPEERACYIDLLIYQHQNGNIPLDTSRLHLYCTGVSNQVVNQVLNDKFKQTNSGWINKKLETVMDSRKKLSPKKIAHATLAGLLSANSLNDDQVKKIKRNFNADDYLEYSKEEIKSKVKSWFYELVNTFVNNKINKDINRDINKNNSKNNSLEEYEKPFSENVLKCFNQCKEYFPTHLRPKPNSKIENNWIDTIDKLHRIDKIPLETICSIVHWARDDNFWSSQFLSLPKLRKKNKEKIPYVVVFNEKMKSDGRYKQQNNQQNQGPTDSYKRSLAERLGAVPPE